MLESGMKDEYKTIFLAEQKKYSEVRALCDGLTRHKNWSERLIDSGDPLSKLLDRSEPNTIFQSRPENLSFYEENSLDEDGNVVAARTYSIIHELQSESFYLYKGKIVVTYAFAYNVMKKEQELQLYAETKYHDLETGKMDSSILFRIPAVEERVYLYDNEKLISVETWKVYYYDGEKRSNRFTIEYKEDGTLLKVFEEMKNRYIFESR